MSTKVRLICVGGQLQMWIWLQIHIWGPLWSGPICISLELIVVVVVMEVNSRSGSDSRSLFGVHSSSSPISITLEFIIMVVGVNFRSKSIFGVHSSSSSISISPELIVVGGQLQINIWVVPFDLNFHSFDTITSSLFYCVVFDIFSRI